MINKSYVRQRLDPTVDWKKDWFRHEPDQVSSGNPRCETQRPDYN